jgi:C1A family cysteine protease
MCSDIGFQDVRDDEGFLGRSIMPWYHAMLIIAIDDRYKRPGALVQNSWGKNWVYGPTRHGQPKGSFWVDAEIIDNAMRQGDSVALSGYVGYPKLKTPDYNIF